LLFLIVFVNFADGHMGTIYFLFVFFAGMFLFFSFFLWGQFGEKRHILPDMRLLQ